MLEASCCVDTNLILFQTMQSRSRDGSVTQPITISCSWYHFWRDCSTCTMFELCWRSVGARMGTAREYVAIRAGLYRYHRIGGLAGGVAVEPVYMAPEMGDEMESDLVFDNYDRHLDECLCCETVRQDAGVDGPWNLFGHTTTGRVSLRQVLERLEL